jgi:hypothetical protein
MLLQRQHRFWQVPGRARASRHAALTPRDCASDPTRTLRTTMHVLVFIDLLFGVRILGLAHRRRAPLGLVTTKTSRVETLDQIRARLGQARRVVDADRLALSP